LAGFCGEQAGKFAAARQRYRLASPGPRAQHLWNDRISRFVPQIGVADGAPGMRDKAPAPMEQRRSVIMQVRHILHGKGRDVISIDAGATIAEAAKLLTDRKIGALIVKDKNGGLSGIISERDLVNAIAGKGAAALSDQISAHMTPSPETCTESDTVESVMEVMTRGRFRHVPVLDNQFMLCGMVSIGDVVKTRIAETVSEAAALRDYISATL